MGVDVAMDGSGAAASRFADYTTTASAAKETKAEEDIPDWKRRMLERQKKDQEKKEEEEAKNRNFGFVPGTTLHSSYDLLTYEECNVVPGTKPKFLFLASSSSFFS